MLNDENLSNVWKQPEARVSKKEGSDAGEEVDGLDDVFDDLDDDLGNGLDDAFGDDLDDDLDGGGQRLWWKRYPNMNMIGI